MAADYRIFKFPILLAEHYHSPAASDPTIKTHRFLADGFYDYLTTERIHVSDLEEATLEMIHKLSEYKNRPGTGFAATVYQV